MYQPKPIGLQNLTWFPLTSDEKGAPATYGAPIKISRAIKATMTPKLAEALLESDDSAEDDLSQLSGYGLSIDASQLTTAARIALFGHSTDGKKGLLVTSTDVAGMGALAFRTLLSKQGGVDKYRYHVLYKGKFKDMVENFETKKKEGINFQVHSGIEGDFVARDSDGHVYYYLDESDEGIDQKAIQKWFEKPVESGAPTEGA